MTIDSQELLKKYDPKETAVISADPQVSAARFSPCGQVLVAGGYDGRVRRWRVDQDDRPELPALAGHNAWVEGLAFTSSDKRLFTADSWGHCRCWDDYAADKPQVVWQSEQAHNGWIRQLAVSPDGKWLASIATDRKLKVWSASDGKLHAEVTLPEDPRVIVWHPSGALLLGDAKGKVTWREAGGDQPFATIARTFDAGILFALSRLQDVAGLYCMALSDAGKQLAVGGVVPKNGGTVTGAPTLLLFDAETAQQTHKFELGDTQDVGVTDVAFHSEGFLSLVTSGTPGKGQLLFLNPAEKTPFYTNKKMANCHSLSWQPKGRLLAVAGTNKNSNGNGRPVDKQGNYPGNSSPIQLFQIPESA